MSSRSYAPKALANGVDTTDALRLRGRGAVHAWTGLLVSCHQLARRAHHRGSRLLCRQSLCQCRHVSGCHRLCYPRYGSSPPNGCRQTDTKGTGDQMQRRRECSADSISQPPTMRAEDSMTQTGLARNGSSSNEALAEKFYAASKVASKYAIDNAECRRATD
jgi:hypothetical protein